MYHDGKGLADGELMQDYLRHADRAALGGRVDEDGNWPTSEGRTGCGGRGAQQGPARWAMLIR